MDQSQSANPVLIDRMGIVEPFGPNELSPREAKGALRASSLSERGGPCEGSSTDNAPQSHVSPRPSHKRDKRSDPFKSGDRRCLSRKTFPAHFA